MLEGLPPNNAAHMMRLTIDEPRARAVADLVVESFEPAEAASTAFETEMRWPGGGKAWQVEVYFGFAPDQDDLRALVAAAAGEEAAAAVEFALTEKRDWVANALAGLAPVRAGRFLVHGAHDRARVGINDIGVEIEAGLAFGTGHHGTTRGCLLHFDRLLKRRRPRKVLDVGCGAGVLAVGLPVYCAGVSPNSPVRNGPGTVGEPIDLGGLRIESGDILIGDRDGVVVVPRARAAAVVEVLATVRAAEAALEAKIVGGLEIPEFVQAILNSDRVHRID